MDQSVEDHWEQHKRTAYPKGISGLEEIQARMSFYAGFQASVESVTRLLKSNTDEATFITKVHAALLECSKYIDTHVVEFARIHLYGKR